MSEKQWDGEDLGDLRTFVESVRGGTPSETQSLHAVKNLRERLDSRHSRRWMIDWLRRPTHAFQVSAFGLVGIVIISLVVLFGIQPWADTPQQALAEVLKRVQAVQNYTVDSVITKAGEITLRQKQYYVEGASRSENDHGGMVVRNRGKQIVLNSDDKTVIVSDISAEGNFLQPLQKTISELECELGVTATDEDLEGIPTKCFRTQTQGTNLDMAVWIDSQTGLPLKIVCHDVNNDATAEYSNYQYNQRLDDSLFSVEVPEGYTIVEPSPPHKDVVPKGPSSQELIDGLQAIAQAKNGHHLPVLSVRSVNEFWDSVLPPRGINVATPESDEKRKSSLRACLFARLHEENDFHYSGEGVTLKDSKTPLCWWRQSDRQDYCVIYGDLSEDLAQPDEVLRWNQNTPSSR